MLNHNHQPYFLIQHSATVVYWCSMLSLLIGIQITIDPFNHAPGEVKHIYITLGLFEVYMWLLLRLGQWQHKNGFIKDNYRSITFAFVLTGFFMIALDELYLVAPKAAALCAILAFGSAIMKARYALKICDLNLSKYAYGFLTGNLALLVFIPMALNLTVTNTANEHLLGYLFSLMIAVWIAAHVLLIHFQNNTSGPLISKHIQLQQKFTWIGVSTLCAFIVTQLYATMWSLDIKWAAFYITPIALSASLITFLCGQLKKNYYFIGTALTLSTIMIFNVTCNASFPEALNMTPLGALAGPLSNVYLINGALFCLIFVSMFVLTKSWWMLLVATAPPVGAMGKTIIYDIWNNKQLRGFTFIIGSFVLLALGMMLQKQQHKLGTAKAVSKKDDEIDHVNQME